MKKFEMSLDQIKKELNIRIWGMYEGDDANIFVEEFKKTIAPLKCLEFVLFFDAEELKVSKQDMLPMLEGCFKMYKDCGFKKIVMKIGKNVTLKMQLSRIAKNIGLAVETV